VAIDLSYGGESFHVAMIDAPEARDDLVAGKYDVPEDDIGERIAVRVTDVLGGEALAVLDRSTAAANGST